MERPGGNRESDKPGGPLQFPVDIQRDALRQPARNHSNDRVPLLVGGREGRLSPVGNRLPGLSLGVFSELRLCVAEIPNGVVSTNKSRVFHLDNFPRNQLIRSWPFSPV